jgi:hypothetical protein
MAAKFFANRWLADAQVDHALRERVDPVGRRSFVTSCPVNKNILYSLTSNLMKDRAVDPKQPINHGDLHESHFKYIHG